MLRLIISGFISFGLLASVPSALAGATCKDGVSPKSSGCPLDFTEQLIAFDNFDTGNDGWSNEPIINAICGTDPMLVLAGDSLSSKQFTALLEHNFVRIQATAYFVDDWQGETAFLSLDDQIIWTESHDQRGTAGSVNFCGDSRIAESKLGVPIDITVPHEAASLTLELATNLPSGVAAGFALDDVRVSVFTYAP